MAKQTYHQEQPDTLVLSAIYNDECTRVNFSYEHENQILGASEPIKTISFTVQLKPLADFSFYRGG